PGFPAEAGSSGGYPAPRLLHHHRDAEFSTQLGDCIKAPSGIMVTFRLDRFLQKIEMDGNRIGIDHRYRPLRPFNTMIPQLNSADIRSQKGFWGHLPDYGKGVLKIRILESCS